MPHVLYISHAPEDRGFRDVLDLHLAALRRATGLEIVDGSATEFVESAREARLRALRDADLIVILVSPSFMASAQTAEVELPQALSRCEREGIPVVPVLVARTALQHTPLDGWAIVPSGDRPIAEPSNHSLWKEVVTGLIEILDSLPPRERA